jgi:site-specific DNA-cytosine methylase
MKVLELFAGTRSISKEFEKRGHEVYTVEWDKAFDNIDLYKDIGELTAQEILENFGHPDVIWASPDCSSYSVAAIYHHRRRNKENGSLEPITDYARFCDRVNQHVLELIKELNPRFYFIENPRGGSEKNVVDAGFAEVYDLLLQIWRNKDETDRYLDKSS